MSNAISRFSFLLITYNHARFIIQSLESICDQTVPPAELVICDDNSTDGTQDKISQWLDSHPNLPFRVKTAFSNSNRGIIENIRAGAKKATSDFVILGSGDDACLPIRVETYRNFIINHPQTRGIYTNATIINESGLTVKESYFGQEDESGIAITSMAKSTSGFLGATGCYHIDVWKSFPPIDQSIINEDLVLPFRAALLGEAYYLPAATVQYRLHSSNLHFGDYSRETCSSITTKARRNSIRRKAVNLQRIADLNHHSTLCGSTPELREAFQYVSNCLELAEFEVSLDSKRPIARFYFILRHFLLGKVTSRQCVRLILLWCMPFAYCYLMRNSN